VIGLVSDTDIMQDVSTGFFITKSGIEDKMNGAIG